MGKPKSSRTAASDIPESAWRWFGSAGHFICGRDCRFHLCTQIGAVLVSTVGQLLFDAPVREILANTRNVALQGMGDARLDDYLRKIGFEDIGYGRKYETMVFRTSGDVCHAPDCGCGLPVIIPRELDAEGYNTAGAATLGHLALCRKYAHAQPEAVDAVGQTADDPT